MLPLRRPCLPSLCAVVLASLLPAPLPSPAAAQVQLRCEGTLLEARGQAEQQRGTRRLQFSLGLESEAATADAALAQLQRRLADVRAALKALGVQELRVTSPGTWQRPVERQRPAAVQASLQVSGYLAPPQLQALVRQVGALQGVRLAPVSPEADPAQDAVVRGLLLRRAYQDALAQARELAAVIGRDRLSPLEVQVDGNEMRPMLMRSAAADAAPPFDPAELPPQKNRLSMLVRFCAQ